MKILMILDHFYPPDIRVAKEAGTLLRAGHEVFLLTPNSRGAPVEEVIDGVKLYRVQPPTGALQRATNRISSHMFNHVNPFWRRHLTHFVSRYGIQALHVHDLPLVKTAILVGRQTGIPVVADLHENYPAAIHSWGDLHTWRGRMLLATGWMQRWRQEQRFCLRTADRIITVVDEAKAYYVADAAIPPDKVAVVMNTEDTASFSSLPLKTEIISKYDPYFTVSYIGGFGGPHRGIQTAIAAMPAILTRIPNALLLLVGNGAYEPALRQLARREGVERAVEFTGWQPFSNIPSYFAASRICVIPHIASEHTDTTVPHKLFQSMVMRKPVVASSAKPLQRIVGETGAGLVYPSGDSHGLAQAILRIYSEPGLAESQGSAGREAATNKYNWHGDSQKLIALYDELS